MIIAQDIKDRVTAAANMLYEEAARADFPTVAAVRARAGTDMNAASLVMREWRRAQTVQAAPVAVEVPDKVRTANATALAVLWGEAQSLANEGLRLAQAAWDTERIEAEALRSELSDAFEAQRQELESAQAQIVAHAHQIAQQQAECNALRTELASATERAGTAQARVVEIERRANDLAGALEHLHADALVDRERQASQLARLQADLVQARGELVSVRASAQTERDQERKEAAKEVSQAREEAARLAGMVDAMKIQQAEFMRAVTSTAKSEVKSADSAESNSASASGNS